VTFAPYAYDASAWSTDSQQIAALSDAAGSIVAALTLGQMRAMANGTGWDTVVPLKEWRARRD
jgi:hypothetical protein